jgi:hypothetical protein
MDRFKIGDQDNLPIFMKPKEIPKKLLPISEPKLYELLNREGCPRIINGKSYIIPTRKFIEWLENQAISA